MLIAVVVIAVAAVVTHADLRGLSSLAGAVAFMLLIWRSIVSIACSDREAVILATLLGCNLAAGSLAQTLLMNTAAPPPNVAGVTAVLVSRVLVIIVMIWWPATLRVVCAAAPGVGPRDEYRAAHERSD